MVMGGHSAVDTLPAAVSKEVMLAAELKSPGRLHLVTMSIRVMKRTAGMKGVG